MLQWPGGTRFWHGGGSTTHVEAGQEPPELVTAGSSQPRAEVKNREEGGCRVPPPWAVRGAGDSLPRVQVIKEPAKGGLLETHLWSKGVSVPLRDCSPWALHARAGLPRSDCGPRATHAGAGTSLKSEQQRNQACPKQLDNQRAPKSSRKHWYIKSLQLLVLPNGLPGVF